MKQSEIVRLGDVAALNPKIEAAALALNEVVDFLPMAGVDSESSVAIPHESYPYCEIKNGYSNFEDGDILVAKITPCFENGKIAQVKLRERFGFGSTEFHVIRPKQERLDARYLVHFLRRNEILLEGERKMTGSAGQRRVPRTFLESLPIRIPSLAEQRRIATILDKADALRAKRREALVMLDIMEQSIFVDMFGNPKANPKGWPTELLGSIAAKITDGEHLNPEFTAEGMPMVMAGNVLEDGVDLQNSKRVEWSSGEKFRRKCNPEFGDLLIVSRGATIGRMCPVKISELFCLMGSVILLKLDSKKILTEFVVALLKHPVMRSALYKTSGSSAQQAIYLKDVKHLQCMVPPMELQLKFRDQARSLSQLASKYRASIRQAEALFQSLQARAFRGGL